MHELSYMIRLARVALDEAEKHPGERPVRLVVEIGELTGVLPEFLLKYYPQAVRGTVLERAVLEVETVAAEAECGGCGALFHPRRESDYRCPDCGGAGARFVRGRELLVKSLAFAPS